MKTKEQAIKEAYGKYFDKIKDYVDENGRLTELWGSIFYLQKNKELAKIIEHLIDNCGVEFIGEHYAIPKSLQGIEDNNGWIKIESDDDLPKETIKCIVCFFDGKNYIEGSVKYRTPELIYSLKQDGQITHYKQIEKIEPPIF